MSVELWFLRHGQTVFNAEHRWQGWSDSPLTELGIEQAVQGAERLRGLIFDQAIVSPLGRAKQTLAIVQRELALEHLSVSIDDRIKERHVGVLAGCATRDMAQFFPNEMKVRLEDPLHWHPLDGESSWEFIHRVRDFFHSIQSLDQSRSHKILVVTHGGVCAQAHTWVLGQDPIYSWELKIPNVALSHYEYLDSKWHCRSTDISLRDTSMTWFPS